MCQWWVDVGVMDGLLMQREVIMTLLCTTWAIQRGFRGCAMDEIWKAAPTTEEYARCYANKQRDHTKETGGKTANLCLKRGRLDKKEDDGWDAVLLRGDRAQGNKLFATPSTAWDLSL